MPQYNIVGFLKRQKEWKVLETVDAPDLEHLREAVIECARNLSKRRRRHFKYYNASPVKAIRISAKDYAKAVDKGKDPSKVPVHERFSVFGEEMCQEYINGSPLQSISKNYKVSHPKLRAYLVSCGIRIRSSAEQRGFVLKES